MADEDENLVIDLDGPDEIDKGAAAKPPPVPGPSSVPQPKAAPISPEVGLKDLEGQLAAERQTRSRVAEENRRLAAERDQAIAFAQEAERRGMSTYELYNEQQLTAANEQLESLGAQQEAAMESGDFKTAAELNRRMHRLGGQLALLERDKATLAQQRATMTAQHQRRPPAPTAAAQPVPTDPIERAIQGRTEPTKAFLRKHPDLIRGDGSLKRTAIEAHERALDDGHTVDTQAYFDYIEKLIGAGSMPSSSVTNGGEPPATRREARAPSLAAPVERGTPPGGGGSGTEMGTFVMTPKMRRLAEEQGVTPKEWALNYVRLLKEGRITPIT